MKQFEIKLEIPNIHTPINSTHCQNFNTSFDADAAEDDDDDDTAAADDAADNGGAGDVEDDA